ncbi:hypothetical protein [Marinococcus halotolerans]|uniref:hypothetical protein n=1 Tax=Marinococcus halotolerans TaxID=301092 RepID=UPI0003B456EC|nr:hypothetical protein [Marinococcus halotolerans]
MKMLKVLKYILMIWLIIHGLTAIVLSLLILTGAHYIDVPVSSAISASMGSGIYIWVAHQLKRKEGKNDIS